MLRNSVQSISFLCLLISTWGYGLPGITTNAVMVKALWMGLEVPSSGSSLPILSQIIYYQLSGRVSNLCKPKD